MKNKMSLIMVYILFSGIINAQQPEEIYSIAKVYKPHEYFVQQAELWWKEIEKNNSNENAWYNYFKTNRMALISFKGDKSNSDAFLNSNEYLKTGGEIIKLSDQFIPNTFTSHYIKWWNRGADPDMFEHLQKAYEIDPSHSEIYDGFVTYYETNGNKEKRKEFNKIWHSFNDLSPGFLNYNYNVLVSIEKGGAIISFGDNDTYPIWMLQDVFGVREDVNVLNISLLTIDSYRKTVFEKLNIPEIRKDFSDGSTALNTNTILDHILLNKPENLPLYINAPAWKILQEHEANLYLVGLVFQYSTDNIDNLALLKKNFEKMYLVDYIKNSFYYDSSTNLVKRTNVNYLPGIIKLCLHYKLSGETEKAEEIKQLGLIIAENGGEKWKQKTAEIFK